MEGREKYLQLLMENWYLKKKKKHFGDIHTPKEQRKLEIHDKKLH